MKNLENIRLTNTSDFRLNLPYEPAKNILIFGNTVGLFGSYEKFEKYIYGLGTIGVMHKTVNEFKNFEWIIKATGLNELPYTHVYIVGGKEVYEYYSNLFEYLNMFRPVNEKIVCKFYRTARNNNYKETISDIDEYLEKNIKFDYIIGSYEDGITEDYISQYLKD